MTKVSERNTRWSAYADAVTAHANAALNLSRHTRAGTSPTAAEVQLEADARVILAGAKAAYWENRPSGR